MSLQHTHITTPFSEIKKNLVVICDGVQSPSNVGSLFRICDAFGVSKIIFCGAFINFNSARLQKTARNTHLRVSYLQSDDILSEIEQLKSKEYRIVALEITANSIPLANFSVAKTKKIALVIGNEQRGISDAVLQSVHDTLHIKMYGNNSSMNVIQAASIALYSLTNN